MERGEEGSMYRRRKGGEAMKKGRGLFIPPIQPYLAAAIIYISATSCFHVHKCANTFAHENIAPRGRGGSEQSTNVTHTKKRHCTNKWQLATVRVVLSVKLARFLKRGSRDRVPLENTNEQLSEGESSSSYGQ